MDELMEHIREIARICIDNEWNFTMSPAEMRSPRSVLTKRVTFHVYIPSRQLDDREFRSGFEEHRQERIQKGMAANE